MAGAASRSGLGRGSGHAITRVAFSLRRHSSSAPSGSDRSESEIDRTLVPSPLIQPTSSRGRRYFSPHRRWIDLNRGRDQRPDPCRHTIASAAISGSLRPAVHKIRDGRPRPGLGLRQGLAHDPSYRHRDGDNPPEDWDDRLPRHLPRPPCCSSHRDANAHLLTRGRNEPDTTAIGSRTSVNPPVPHRGTPTIHLRGLPPPASSMIHSRYVALANTGHSSLETPCWPQTLSDFRSADVSLLPSDSGRPSMAPTNGETCTSPGRKRIVRCSRC